MTSALNLLASARSAVLVLSAVVVTGCTVGPGYVSPEKAAQESADPRWAETWAATSSGSEPGTDSVSTSSAALAAEAPREAPDLDRWWRRFGDPGLDRLVDEALASNPGLHAATARVAEARALRDRVAGRRLPTVATSGSIAERRQSENGPLPIDRIPGLDRDQTVFDIGFDASWEIDLAGRTRRALEAAEARLGGAEAERHASHLRVAAEVTRTYISLREGQRRLGFLEDQLTSIERTRRLVELRVEAGEDPRLDLARVDADLRSLQARLPTLRADLRAAALALGVLVGSVPESGLYLLDTGPRDVVLAPFPLGARADLLRRRPDVRAAERRLAASTAEIGVATAELYPRLSIGARGGFEALDAGDLFESASATWSLLPAISWRLFDGGRVRAEIRLAEARAEQAAHAWEAVVLEALGDAERALARYRGGLDALGLAQEAVDAAESVVRLERLRHEAGETPLLPLLDAERRLDEARVALSGVRTATATELVAVYKALGGGWYPSDEPRNETDEDQIVAADPTPPRSAY